MAAYQSRFLQTLAERGFIHQCTDDAALDALLAEGEKNGTPVAAYIGFDCTAPSLHVGSLVQIMMLHWLQQCGHKPVVLLGGGTTRIGDPSGKDESRKLLDDAGIAANMAGIQQVFSKFVRFGTGPTDALLVNNADWLDGLNYIAFLRDYGRLFSVNRMLSMDSVKLRIEREQHLSFLEFNYMILQAYDFVELNKRHGVRLQMGGSDQWGNIVSGTDLQHKCEGAPVFGLTTPLLTTASGAKMGKTANGAVWLNAEALSPYEFWQYWRNTADADVGKFLKLFTTLPMEEIARLEALQDAAINEAKIILANAITTMAHGAEAAAAAAETARQTFAGGAGAALPEITLPLSAIADGMPAFELFAAAFESSKGDARRLIRGGGARVNDAPISDENTPITLPEGTTELKLSSGKKTHKRVVFA